MAGSLKKYDRIIIGAGLYGLYSALFCANKGLSVLVLEKEPDSFSRATYINQARVHMGYHYPRSLSTATKSAGYFRRFVEDYGFCIHDKFEQIYATSAAFSWTNAEQFKEFCRAAKIKCEEVPAGRWFKPGMCDGAFLTEEYTYDAHILRDYFLSEIGKLSNITLSFDSEIQEIIRDGSDYRMRVEHGHGAETESAEYATGFILNSTYASVNQIIKKVFPEDAFAIKYELCEIILCDVDENLKSTGLTVMDGPFFSIMPFGCTGQHSLTSVTFTPHVTSYDELPTFGCQARGSESGYKCSPQSLGNCNRCPRKPESSWDYMSHLAFKYMKDEYGFRYKESLFSMKPILKSSEIDDSRPTSIRVHSQEPTFISVLSGKINTVYDLDELLV
ncbi:MAG: FAD-binding oxidoreductase [Butyrivibrio sp.]|nr:FAD-binding oxidoreductase [Butyrivibrio sp.]